MNDLITGIQCLTAFDYLGFVIMFVSAFFVASMYAYVISNGFSNPYSHGIFVISLVIACIVFGYCYRYTHHVPYIVCVIPVLTWGIARDKQ